MVVRCFQCETFQVTQEKKNPNWTCAVCNAKQSLKQVFSRLVVGSLVLILSVYCLQRDWGGLQGGSAGSEHAERRAEPLRGGTKAGDRES